MFAEDNHFADCPQFFELSDPSVCVGLRDLLERFYGGVFPSPPDIKLIGGANINSGNFLVGGHYLKTLTIGPNIDYVDMFPVLAESLRAAGLPAARFVKNDNGDSITYYAGPTGQKLCLFIQEFIDAQFYSGSINELEAGIEMLTRIPMAVSQLIPTPGQSRHYRDWKPIEIIESVEPLLGRHAGSISAFDEFILRFFPIAKRVVKGNLVGDLDTSHLNHVDLHPHNLLMKNSRPAAVLDLESFWAIPAEVSIGFALFKLARKTVSKGFLKPDEIRSIFKMAGFDTQSLLAFAQLEIARRFLTICKLHYLDKNFLWDKDIFKQAYSFAEADTLLG